jgi:hypothetical protein
MVTWSIDRRGGAAEWRCREEVGVAQERSGGERKRLVWRSSGGAVRGMRNESGGNSTSRTRYLLIVSNVIMAYHADDLATFPLLSSFQGDLEGFY